MTLRPSTASALLWTDSQVAIGIGLPKKRIQLLARLRILPGFKIGRAWRFDPEAIRRWISEMTAPKHVQ
jgi:hypothetical protein